MSNQEKADFILSKEARRYFISDEDYVWWKKTNGTSGPRSSKRDALNKRILDWERAAFCYVNQTWGHRKEWLKLAEQYKLPFGKPPVREPRSKKQGPSDKDKRLEVQKIVVSYVKKFEPKGIGRRKTFWHVKDTYDKVSEGVISRTITKMLTKRILLKDRGKLRLGKYGVFS